MVEPERVADGQHLLTDTQRLGIADDHRLERGFGSLNLQHRKIVIRIGADDFCFEFRTIGQGHRDRIRAVNNMIIGDDVALPAPHEARPRALRHFEQIERPGIALHRRVGDEHHGPRGAFKHGDGRLFLRTELGRRGRLRNQQPVRALRSRKPARR
jgi:hypothetical protein